MLFVSEKVSEDITNCLTMLKNNYFCGEIFFILLEMLEVAEAS
jgi:hypothetical protein